MTWSEAAEFCGAQGSGEPDNDSCNQDCAALGGVGNGKWTDTHCASCLPFVCRR